MRDSVTLNEALFTIQELGESLCKVELDWLNLALTY